MMDVCGVFLGGGGRGGGGAAAAGGAALPVPARALFSSLPALPLAPPPANSFTVTDRRGISLIFLIYC